MYKVFFGFTKPIKRQSEMNSAPDIYISLHNTVLEDLVNKLNMDENSKEESLVIEVIKARQIH